MRTFAGAIAICGALLLTGCASRPVEQAADGKKIEPQRRASIFETTVIVTGMMLAAREHVRRQEALRRAKGAVE